MNFRNLRDKTRKFSELEKVVNLRQKQQKFSQLKAKFLDM